ncbi:hypothetical protein SO802_001074 [Lithocarpus litseifolius]|uniref:Uncharacterized protein n=1 Tax=Lithocarpus litseifolius TaxID=425828 RepID=A0AAW2DXK6_9ROSI
MHEGVSSGTKPSRSISLQEFALAEVAYSSGNFVMHEGISSRIKPNGLTSLQEFGPTEVAYSNGDMIIALQEVLSKTLQFHNGVYSHLVNLIPNNLATQYEPYASHYVNLFLENEAFGSHFVSHVTNDPYTSQLFGKEEIHSMDKMTIMGTDYARLSLKTRSLLRSVIAYLPTEMQVSILESKAMFRSFDLWYKYFKKLVTATIPNPDDLDVGNNVFIQLDWEENFGKSLRVYENKHLFPDLLINYEDGSDEEGRDSDWLSQMFEFGFIRFIKITSHDQISQLPQIIQKAVSKINSPSITVRC